MKSGMLKKPLPYLALLIAHLIWGANFVVAKITLTEIPVFSLSFLRFALAALLILPFILVIKGEHKRIKIDHLPKLLGIGVLMVAFSILLFFEGLKRTTAINASVLTMAVPMLSVLGGWWFLKEKIFIVNLLGVLVGLLGAIIVIGLPILFTGNIVPSQLIGNFLILLSSISFVSGAILARQMLKIYPALFITGFAFLVGALIFIVPAINEYIQNPGWVKQVSVLGVLGLLYITILSSVTAFLLHNWGLSKTNLVQSNLFQYIEPAIAASIAVPLLGERISFSFIIGTCLIVLGVYWGTLAKTDHHHHHFHHHRS